MSLDFKKWDYGSEVVIPGSSPQTPTKESALSLLLERSKDTTKDDTTAYSSPPSPKASNIEEPNAPGQVDVPSTVRSDARLDAKSDASVRIPSSSFRRSSAFPSSLQQQRNRALTGESFSPSTPNSSILGTSSGYGPLFGAGEIGSVSSPRHYSMPIQRDNFHPSSIDDRFVVNIPRTSNQSSTNNSIARSLSKVSLSRSSSRSSFISLRRFVDKPWKNDAASLKSESGDQTPGSPDSSTVSLAGSGSTGRRSRKDSIASFVGSDEDGDSSFYNSTSVHTPKRGSIVNNGTASLTQLDQQYASSYHGQSSSAQRQKQSLKAYGKLGKTLGEGAGGHVKMIKSNKDGQTYAVKEFRARHHSETLRDYNKKVGAEYCLGLTLKHPNIVNTVDIIYETDKVYQIMEYASYDLFAIVMSGKMTTEEVYCDFRQLMEGIRYLHSSGLAHRDLKLDNCVVTEQGIVKIIDFGSSVVYKYPESDKVYDCDGVVGSDPYLAPEAASKGSRYHPAPTDLWSAAIVLCCMLMRKFPWKAPRMSDSAFKAFVHEEEDGSRPGLIKLLSSLPEETHRMLTGMLDLDPETRYDINQCWEDSFLGGSSHCALEDEESKHSSGHKHTSVMFEEAHIAMLEKKNRKAKKGEKMW